MVGKRFLSLSYIPSPPFPVYFETGPNQIAQADFALSFVACVCIEPPILLAKPPGTLGSQAWCEFLSLILILHLFELVSEYESGLNYTCLTKLQGGLNINYFYSINVLWSSYQMNLPL